MTLIVPRVAGISPELSAFYENIARENARLKKLIGQLDDTLADTRISLGLTDNRLSDFADLVDANGKAIENVGNVISGATQSINDRVTSIEENYSQFAWDQVKINMASISVTSGTYNQVMPGYTLTAQKTGWHEVSVSLSISPTGTGILGILIDLPSNTGFILPFGTSSIIKNLLGTPAVDISSTGLITDECFLAANNGSSQRFSMFRYFVKATKDDDITMRLAKPTAGNTLTATVSATNIFSIRHLGDEI